MIKKAQTVPLTPFISTNYGVTRVSKCHLLLLRPRSRDGSRVDRPRV
jgi:hypothetical protein